MAVTAAAVLVRVRRAPVVLAVPVVTVTPEPTPWRPRVTLSRVRTVVPVVLAVPAVP
jgi:hypothetical protein